MQRLLPGVLGAFFFALMLTVSVDSYTEDLSDGAQREISHLFAFIAASDCRFIRNGQEHSTEQAVEHIRRKFNAVKKRIRSTEDFITFAASRSSITGIDYMVRCGDTVIPSQDWLNAELDNFRKSAGAKVPDQ